MGKEDGKGGSWSNGCRLWLISRNPTQGNDCKVGGWMWVVDDFAKPGPEQRLQGGWLVHWTRQVYEFATPGPESCLPGGWLDLVRARFRENQCSSTLLRRVLSF